ncbi:hypothetical protein SAMN02745866_02089 [Alteromonadaceae bacterium Bs31]|nr:hypothetical protein SAMN02745866_02089 [Alteromonadaceae bacterium Bs31]
MSDKKSIYERPKSNLVNKNNIPDSFLNGKVTEKSLKNARSYTLASLLLSVPLIYYLLKSLAGQTSSQLDVIARVCEVISVGLWVYIIYTFGLCLNVRFKFYKINKIIFWNMGLSVAITLVGMLLNSEDTTFNYISLTYVLLLIAYGVNSILMGRALFDEKVFYPYMRMFAWSTVAGGVCMASIILFIFALPFGLISLFALLVIFHRLVWELESSTVKDEEQQ